MTRVCVRCGDFFSIIPRAWAKVGGQDDSCRCGACESGDEDWTDYDWQQHDADLAYDREREFELATRKDQE